MTFILLSEATTSHQLSLIRTYNRFSLYPSNPPLNIQRRQGLQRLFCVVMNIVPKHTTHGVYAVLIALLIQLFLSVPQAYASPVSDASFTLDSYVASNASANLAKRFRGDVAPRDPDFNEAPNVSDFPDTLDIQAAVRQNLGTTFVFWTEVPNREGSDRARQFARQVGGVYIRDAYPSNYM